jgi:hypothetical protein
MYKILQPQPHGGIRRRSVEACVQGANVKPKRRGRFELHAAAGLAEPGGHGVHVLDGDLPPFSVSRVASCASAWLFSSSAKVFKLRVVGAGPAGARTEA